MQSGPSEGATHHWRELQGPVLLQAHLREPQLEPQKEQKKLQRELQQEGVPPQEQAPQSRVPLCLAAGLLPDLGWEVLPGLEACPQQQVLSGLEQSPQVQLLPWRDLELLPLVLPGFGQMPQELLLELAKGLLRQG